MQHPHIDRAQITCAAYTMGTKQHSKDLHHEATTVVICKSTQGFPIHPWACSHKRGGVSSRSPLSAECYTLFYKWRANCNTTEIQHMQGVFFFFILPLPVLITFQVISLLWWC